VRGVVNVRGQIVAVIDIKEFFNLPTNILTDLNKVIILGGGETRLAILADQVLGVREVDTSALQPSLPTLGGVGAEYLKGITNERLMVLDAHRILSDERIVVDEEVTG
jgi:purine-binding chemotaxis protein CheW